MKPQNISRCDIFCTVIDNYGDIGVCWRLARQLANEYDIAVRLWVDDLASFGKLSPEIDLTETTQHSHGVEIRRWDQLFVAVEPAQLVIEAFACDLPEPYVLAMAAQKHKSIWLNLEYLSAESWVVGCHGLPSPHPSLPLIKYFFFPGFTPGTGGLLLEHDLLARRDKFLADTVAQENYWLALGVAARQQGEMRVSLFGYENHALAALLTVWAEGKQPVTCLVPEGRILPQIAGYFGCQSLQARDVVQQGGLRVHVLPFVEQEEYDKLLWACDFNFVRGEDSCVRAQWAGKPFIWHIYPQHDGVHMKKLQALLVLYSMGLEHASAHALGAVWRAWNAGEVDHQTDIKGWTRLWNDLLLHQSQLAQHAVVWSENLSANKLALNLLDFSRNVGRIAPLKI